MDTGNEERRFANGHLLLSRVSRNTASQHEEAVPCDLEGLVAHRARAAALRTTNAGSYTPIGGSGPFHLQDHGSDITAYVQRETPERSRRGASSFGS